MSIFDGKRVELGRLAILLLVASILFLAVIAPLSYIGNKRTHVRYDNGVEIERTQTYWFNHYEYINRCSMTLMFDIAIITCAAVHNLALRFRHRSRPENLIT